MWPALVMTLTLLSGTQETVAAIQIHGNTITSDDEIRVLAGIDVGAPADETAIADLACAPRSASNGSRCGSASPRLPIPRKSCS
jgi:hypothetical protein